MSKANGAPTDALRSWLYFIADVEYNVIMFARSVGYWCWNNPLLFCTFIGFCGLMLVTFGLWLFFKAKKYFDMRFEAVMVLLRLLKAA